MTSDVTVSGVPAPLTVYARLHLYPPDHMAGAEMMVHSMFRALIARGHRVEVWLTHYSQTINPYELDGVRVHPLNPRDQPNYRNCDVIVSHLENVPFASAISAQYRKPFVNIVHNERDLTKVWRKAKTELFVYNSEWVADSMGRDVPHIVVRPPIIAEDYKTTPGDRITLINLNPEKGGKVFYELARRMPDKHFLAVEGAYGPQERWGCDNVDFVPHTMNMRDEVYSRTRILLMPSSYESWGRTAVEAMVSGIPVIAHPTEGLVECLGEAGTFADRDDIAAWVAAIRRLDNDKYFGPASRRSLKRAEQLDPTDDLTSWCDAMEGLVGR